MQVGPIAYILLVGSADVLILTTPQESNISDLGKRKIIFKSALVADMLVPWRVSTCPLPYIHWLPLRMISLVKHHMCKRNNAKGKC